MAEKDIVVDLFCGAGGASTGVVDAAREAGKSVKLIAVDHWSVAIATHQLNHPTADHYTADINVIDPEAVVPEGRVDVLVASPECRHFSRARGGKPLSDQSRMNPWAVHAWITALDVKRVLIENVPEFVSWGPLNDERRPDPDRKGLYFEEWVRSLWGLGYDVDWRVLNSADYGEATSRVRFFLQARKDAKPILWPEPTHSRDGGGMMDDLPRWRGAREVIDWSNPGRSLLDDPKYKKRPLSVKTRLRIARGIQRFCGPLAPFYTRLLDIPDDLLPVDRPMPAIAAAGAISFVRPIVSEYYGNGGCRSVDEPLSTVTTKARHGLAQPMLIVEEDTGEVDPNRLVSIDGQLYKLDIRYRMLQNPELARAMGFTTDERDYEFVGTIREVTKQIGNAVPVRMATALARAMLR